MMITHSMYHNSTWIHTLKQTNIVVQMKQKTNKIKLFSYQEAIAPTQSTIDQNSIQKLKARKKISQT